MKNVFINKLMLALVFIIGILSSCSKEEVLIQVEDGNAPEIEFKIAYNGNVYALSSKTDYSQKYLNLPAGKDLTFDLNVTDKGALDEVDIRMVKFEHELISYNTTPAGWWSSETDDYDFYNYDHPFLAQDISTFSANGVWQTNANEVLYIIDFDRDLLITAADREGHTSEIRIAVERSNEESVGLHSM